jgi:hypothetical protein
MEMCDEMIKLRKLLTQKGIEWQDQSIIQQEELIARLSAESGFEREYFDTTIYRTHFDYKGSHYSVINGFGTYGGYEPFEKKNYGLLELMRDDNNPVGWLTAQEIIDSLDMTRQQ